MAFSCQFHPPANLRVSASHHDYRSLSPRMVESAQARMIHFKNQVRGFGSKSLNLALSTSLSLALSLTGVGASEAALVGVNKPELLPKEYATVIDVAGFLSDGQEKRIAHEISDLEKDTGFKLRVLAQNYPDTPGLAIKDFWQVDDRTIVFVADPTFGNILNFNVGKEVDLDVPQSFWSRLAGKYGNMFYWKDKGEDASIEAAVNAVASCLREPVGPSNCSETLLLRTSFRLGHWRTQNMLSHMNFIISMPFIVFINGKDIKGFLGGNLHMSLATTYG